MQIDIYYNFYTDTPKGKDPDTYSDTLRKYHQFLWSKPLPNGVVFNLDIKKIKVLCHKSELGEFLLSSDSIAHDYSKWKSTENIIKQIPKNEIETFFNLGCTIGGYIIFPSNRINNQMTINGSRGINKKIKDRFDLTLECIRRFYLNENSPLTETFNRYRNFFKLFDNFKGYVDFFFLQDLVKENRSSINYFLPFNNFKNSPIPSDITEYKLYRKNMTEFINKRSKRMKEYSLQNDEKYI
tara:strand:+ start:79 stop:798 length:720 start_codon:yes stop_codon:yes gene_type:complete